MRSDTFSADPLPVRRSLVWILLVAASWVWVALLVQIAAFVLALIF